jgi:hypothetical protein
MITRITFQILICGMLGLRVCVCVCVCVWIIYLKIVLKISPKINYTHSDVTNMTVTCLLFNPSPNTGRGTVGVGAFLCCK